MATNYVHRVLLAIPNARKAAVVAWWDANIDPGQGATTWSVGLSATGNLPAVAWWCSVALTDDQLRTLAIQLCAMANITPPANWGSLTIQQKRQWVIDNAPAIQTATGMRIVRDDNDAAWSDPDTLLAAAGLQRIGHVGP